MKRKFPQLKKTQRELATKTSTEAKMGIKVYDEKYKTVNKNSIELVKGLDRSLADDGIGSCDKVAQLKAVNEAQQSEIKILREQIKRLRTLAASTHSLRSSRPPVSLRSSSASGSSDLHIKPRFKRNNTDPPRDGMDASALQHQSKPKRARTPQEEEPPGPTGQQGDDDDDNMSVDD